MTADVNVAFCGCGATSRRHARVLARLGATVVACWNAEGHLGSAESLARETGARYFTDDLARVAGDPSIDAVYVCTWPHQRVELLETLAAAGKAVFMEKPLASNRDDLRRMAEILRRHPIVFQAGLKTRFNSAVVEGRRRMTRCEAVVVQVHDRRWAASSRGADPSLGGGHVLDQGIYGFELAWLLAGSRPESVHATGMADVRFGPLAATVRFASGAVATVMVSDAGSAPAAVSKFSATAAGDGTVVVLSERFTTLTAKQADGTEETLRFAEDGFGRQSAAFLRAVAAAEQPSCGFLDGAIACEMVFAARESLATGHVMAINVPG